MYINSTSTPTTPYLDVSVCVFIIADAYVNLGMLYENNVM